MAKPHGRAASQCNSICMTGVMQPKPDEISLKQIACHSSVRALGARYRLC